MPTKDRKDKFARHRALIQKKIDRYIPHWYNDNENAKQVYNNSNYWGIFNKTGDKNKPKYCELHRDNDMLNTYKRQQKCVNYKKCKKIAACHHDIDGKHYCTVCFYNTCESFDAIVPLRLSCIYCSSCDYN